MPHKYPESFRARAVRMVTDRLEADPEATRFQVICETAPKLNIAVETLRRWYDTQIPDPDSGGPTVRDVDVQAELKRLKRENAELRRANEILKTASAFFAAEPGRPTTK